MPKIIYKKPKSGPKSRPTKRLTTKEFIERARKVHGNKYNYSKVKYTGYRDKVTIICSIHGEFKQSPDSHIHNHGCPECGKISEIKKRTISVEEFIKKARKVHGNRYDYSKTKLTYKNSKSIVDIICPEHGEFKQKAGFHWSGNGCPVCAILLNSMKRTSTTKEFIKKARMVHGTKYDYSKVDYKNNSTKVIIICCKHGKFKQRPACHLQGQGCPKCGKLLIGSGPRNNRLSTKEFIRRAKKVHGNRYDYSKIDYKNIGTKVIIICKEHGEFKQRPYCHIAGQGCPNCLVKGRDRSTDPNPGYLYLIKSKSFCKIGTAYNTKKRFNQFPFEIVDSLIVPGIIGPLSIIEEKIKKDFAKHHYSPIKFGGHTECFSAKAYPKILKYIKRVLI